MAELRLIHDLHVLPLGGGLGGVPGGDGGGAADHLPLLQAGARAGGVSRHLARTALIMVMIQQGGGRKILRN